MPTHPPPVDTNAVSTPQPALTAGWGCAVTLSGVVVLVSWVWSLCLSVWVVGVVLLSLLGGADLLLLRAWPPEQFEAGVRVAGVCMIGTLTVFGLVLWLRRVHRKTLLWWWLALAAVWFGVGASISLLGLVADLLGVAPALEAAGPVFLLVGWLALWPLAVVWLQWRALNWIWAAATRWRWAAVATVALALVAIGLVPVPFVVAQSAEAEAAEAAEYERYGQELTAWWMRTWPVAWDVGAAGYRMDGFTNTLRTLFLLSFAEPLRDKLGGGSTPRPTGYVLAMTWHPGFCSTLGGVARLTSCSPVKEAYTLHGLWPQKGRFRSMRCGGDAGFDDSGWELHGPPEMSAGLGRYQWQKHGACAGRSQSEYFWLTQELWARVRRPKPSGASGTVEVVRSERLRMWTVADGLDSDAVVRAALVCRPRVSRSSLRTLVEVRVCFDAHLKAVDCPARVGDSCPSEFAVNHVD